MDEYVEKSIKTDSGDVVKFKCDKEKLIISTSKNNDSIVLTKKEADVLYNFLRKEFLL